MRWNWTNRWAIYGGAAGMVLGGLIVLGVLTLAHLGQGRGTGRPTDPDAAALHENEEAATEPASMVQAGHPESSGPAPTRFPATTWGLLARIALEQLESGDEDASFRTLAMIPPQDEGDALVYRTGRDKAYFLMLNRFLRRQISERRKDAPAQRGDWLPEAERIAARLGEGLPRAGAWLKILDYLRLAGKKPETSDILHRAVAEASRPATVEAPTSRFLAAWEMVGGWLMLLWPVGMTALGALGAEVSRRVLEGFAEEAGTAAARWFGIRGAADGVPDAVPAPELASGSVGGTDSRTR